MKIYPFHAWRPAPELADQIASPPYDVVNTDEARALAEGNPLSFLHVVRSEIDLPPGTDPYSDAVYDRAAEQLEHLKKTGALLREESPCFYLYSQQMDQHIQYGVVACCAIEDYENGRIKIHEKTRKAKEQDRTRHIDRLSAHTGPVFLTFRDTNLLPLMMEKISETDPIYRFTAADGIIHTVWKIEQIGSFAAAFSEIPALYVADGHHRSASAAAVGRARRDTTPDATGEEPFNRFLCVIFPASQLNILPYNRVVSDLNGMSPDQFLKALDPEFRVTPSATKTPGCPGSICLYLDGQWVRLTPTLPAPDDPVDSLDVSLLQDRLLSPILGIEDPRESDRIDFVGGIHGTDELERRVDSGQAAAAFSLHPTSMEQLLAVADANRLMPPKSTWFEPKLRSGLLVHCIDDPIA